MNNVSFSIIVLSHNNQHIDLVLNSIIAQTEVTDEIIVVDDHSEKVYLQNFETYITNNNIKLIKAKKMGNRSHNRNIGAQCANKDILLFVDGDMVLIDNALSILRYAHMYRTEEAFIGPKHNIHYDIIHFELFSGIKNYIDLLSTSAGRKQLSEAFFSKDEREDFFNDKSNKKFFWMHYYTGASSVSNNIFIKCGGFDENFTSWGSEDVDLGYRISQYCDIGFLNDFHSFHIPHNRDAFTIETSNMYNTLQMLEKYKTWEFEVLYAFNGNPNIQKSFNNIIQQMRTLSLTHINDTGNNNCLIINSISKEYPDGNIIACKDSNYEYLTLLGLVLPMPSMSFDITCISENIFIYPPIVVSRIIQEALRVSKNVYIQRTNNDIRIDWNGKLFFPFQSTNHKIAYRSEDTMDYSFENDGDKIKVLPQIPDNVLRSPIFWEN